MQKEHSLAEYVCYDRRQHSKSSGQGHHDDIGLPGRALLSWFYLIFTIDVNLFINQHFQNLGPQKAERL
jgi:hypothetical protein